MTPIPPRHEVVTTRDGGTSIRDTHQREVMHPVVGARAESEALYAGQSRLRERLSRIDWCPNCSPKHQLPSSESISREAPSGELVLFDAGLGAGSNALAARRVSESLATRRISEPLAGPRLSDAPVAQAARRLCIVSFENDLGALELALQPQHAAAFGLDDEAGEAARALIERGEHETERTRWILRRGDLLEQLEREPLRAEVIFWDPFSPRANPQLWTAAAFSLLRARCAANATLFTYAAATSVRAAMLLGGFAVGLGDGTGTTRETTAAACDPNHLAHPLGARWLERLTRSSAPFPPDAPPDALERIRAAPQFRSAG